MRASLRAGHLLLMLGFAVVAYLALITFDEAARADGVLPGPLPPSAQSTLETVPTHPAPRPPERKAVPANPKPKSVPAKPVPAKSVPAKSVPAKPAPVQSVLAKPVSAKPVSAKPVSAKPGRPASAAATPKQWKPVPATAKQAKSVPAKPGQPISAPAKPRHVKSAATNRLPTPDLRAPDLGAPDPRGAGLRGAGLRAPGLVAAAIRPVARPTIAASPTRHLSAEAAPVTPTIRFPVLSGRNIAPGHDPVLPELLGSVDVAVGRDRVMPESLGSADVMVGRDRVLPELLGSLDVAAARDRVLPALVSILDVTAGRDMGVVVLPALPSGLDPTGGHEAVAGILPVAAGLPALPAAGVVGGRPAALVVTPQALPTRTAQVGVRPAVLPMVFLPDRTPLAPRDGAQPPAARARIDATVPLPGRSAPPPGPAGQSAGAGQSRDAGGGSSPTMSTVPAFWWPTTPAAAVLTLTDVSVAGRSVRYSGPPS